MRKCDGNYLSWTGKFSCWRGYIKPWDRRGDPPNDLRQAIRESEECLQLHQADRLNHHYLRCRARQYSPPSNCVQSASMRSSSPWELQQPLAFFTLHFSFFPLQSSSLLTSVKWLSARFDDGDISNYLQIRLCTNYLELWNHSCLEKKVLRTSAYKIWISLSPGKIFCSGFAEMLTNWGGRANILHLRNHLLQGKILQINILGINYDFRLTSDRCTVKSTKKTPGTGKQLCG